MASFSKFVSGLKLSDVKLTLLKRLWGDSEQLAPSWVKSSELLQMTGQKYFDRRLRELRDHEGLDLESKVIGGEHCWMLKSVTIESKMARTYLTAEQKSGLFRSVGNKCAVCGKIVAAGIRGLQADHKIPLSRGGSEEIANWQALCHDCNVVKRRICQGCELDCRNCSWAFPEKISTTLIVQLPDEVKKVAENENVTSTQLNQLITEFLKSKFRR